MRDIDIDMRCVCAHSVELNYVFLSIFQTRGFWSDSKRLGDL